MFYIDATINTTLSITEESVDAYLISPAAIEYEHTTKEDAVRALAMERVFDGEFDVHGVDFSNYKS